MCTQGQEGDSGRQQEESALALDSWRHAWARWEGRAASTLFAGCPQPTDLGAGSGSEGSLGKPLVSHPHQGSENKETADSLTVSGPQFCPAPWVVPFWAESSSLTPSPQAGGAPPPGQLQTGSSMKAGAACFSLAQRHILTQRLVHTARVQ